MLKQVTILVICFYAFSLSCSKDDTSSPGTPNPPPVTKTFTISGLEYSPGTVPIKLYSTFFGIRGSLDYVNANTGVNQLRLHTSLGWDTTLIIPYASNQTSGKVIGNFEISMPKSPVQFMFEVWLVDMSGKESNKLSGQVNIIIDDSGVKWNAISISILRVLNDIGWYNNQFIGVGNGGTIGTSLDGLNWTLRPIFKKNNLKGLTWTGNQYVTVGDFGTIYTSPDAINWTNRSMDADYNAHLNSVASSGSVLVAVGQRSMLSSPDGITWTPVNLPETNIEFNSVIWTGTRFIAAGAKYNTESGYEPVILSSADGSKWAVKYFASLHNTYFYDAIQAGDKIICIGYGISAISTNGQEWIMNEISKSTAIFSLAWSGRKLVGVGNGIFVSEDGIEWQQTYPGNDLMNNFKCVAWSGYGYAAAGQFEYSLMVSP